MARTRSVKKRSSNPEENQGSRVPKRSRKNAVVHPVQHDSHRKTPGEVFVWGVNECGQLGLGETVEERQVPARLRFGNGLKVLDIATGGMHSIALTEDQNVWTWGTNDEGELGRKTDGSAWADDGGEYEDSTVPGKVEMPPEAGKVVQVCAGDSISFLLTDEGEVWGFGMFRNRDGKLGFTAQIDRQRVPARVYKVKNPGKRAMRIACGASHVAALLEDGSVVTWGDGEFGQLGTLGPRSYMGRKAREKKASMLTPRAVRVPEKVVDVMCGWYNTFLITTTGRVFVMGLNNYQQLDNRGGEPPLLYSPVQPNWLKKGQFVSFASGRNHTLALTKEGDVFAFGCAYDGRLGLEKADDVEVKDVEQIGKPTKISHVGGGVSGLAVGDTCSGCFSKESKKMWTWGGHDSCLLAMKGEKDQPLPCLVETSGFKEREVIWMGFGGQHAACLTLSIHQK